MATALKKHAVDRRVQKTRALLREALASLIREKPYDAITVTEILDRANVGRSTFYMHFRDKDELLVSGIHDLLGAASGAPAPAARRSERVVRFSLPILEHIDQHRRASLGSMGTGAWAVVHEHLRRVVAELIADEVRDALRERGHPSRPTPPDLLVECVAATFVLTLNWWVESGSRLSAGDANDVFRALILPTLHALLER